MRKELPPLESEGIIQILYYQQLDDHKDVKRKLAQAEKLLQQVLHSLV